MAYEDLFGREELEELTWTINCLWPMRHDAVEVRTIIRGMIREAKHYKQRCSLIRAGE
jgi:hypothetical protein